MEFLAIELSGSSNGSDHWLIEGGSGLLVYSRLLVCTTGAVAHSGWIPCRSRQTAACKVVPPYLLVLVMSADAISVSLYPNTARQS